MAKKVKKTTTKNTIKKSTKQNAQWTPFMILLANMLADIYEPSVCEGKNVPNLSFDELYEMWGNDIVARKKPFKTFAKLYFDYKDSKVTFGNVDEYLKSLS